MRVRQGNVDRLQLDGMAQLAPVRGHHVGCRPQPRGASELGHRLATRVAILRAAGVLSIREDPPLSATQLDSLFQGPGTVWIQGNAGPRKTFRQRGDSLDLRLAREHATFELEIV